MTKAPMEIRVCSYNIHKGFCAANRRPVLQEIRQAIRSTDADLMFLQEVVGERKGHKAVDIAHPQFEYLADEMWPHHAYGRNAIYQQGHHGNAILSKSPFLSWSNLNVSQWQFSQRGILYGQLENGVVVVCIHFGLMAWERRRQLNMLHTDILSHIDAGAPIIIAGDFNDWNKRLHSQLINKFGFKEACSEHYGNPAKTFPARFPLLPMDRIYYRNLTIKDAEVLSGCGWGQLSDHHALYAVLETV